MSVIRDSSIKDLLLLTESLRKKKSHWWAIWVSLSQLGSHKSKEALIKTLENSVNYLSLHGDWTIHLIETGDAILLTEHIASNVCGKTMNEITFMLTDDAEHTSKDTGKLCKLYQTSEDLDLLRQTCMDLQHRIQASLLSSAPNPSALLNPNFFKTAALQRRDRELMSVLIVEDQRFSRQMVIEILGKGFEKHSAADGIEALKMYESYAPDIVFLDIDLPHISGQKVLDRITEVDPKSFVVMLTASQLQKDVEYALQHGAMGYIVKPFTKQKIDKYLTLFQKNFARDKI